MDVRELAIATVTLARADDARTLRDSLEALSATGAAVTVADGGSPTSFVRAAARLPNVTLLQVVGESLVGQVRASLTHARRTGARVLLYTEPDKRDFFRMHLPAFLEAAAPDENTGIVLASRTPAAFATFPPVQQYTETVANQLCGDATRLDADFMYGPFLVHPRLLPFLEDLPAAVGWGWRPFLFGLAPRLGLRVRSVAGDYTCPPAYCLPDEAERLHRMRQLSQNVDGLVRAFSVVIDRDAPARQE